MSKAYIKKSDKMPQNILKLSKIIFYFINYLTTIPLEYFLNFLDACVLIMFSYDSGFVKSSIKRVL